MGICSRMKIEDFSRKAETSTLAHLRQSLARRSQAGESFREDANSIEMFFVTGASASGSGEADRGNGLELHTERVVHTQFDLSSYCDSVLEEYIFTKAFISTAYTCLGCEIFVPPSVLEEIFDFRCEQVRGSSNFTSVTLEFDLLRPISRSAR